MKIKTRKVGIGFITGRKSFRDVLTTYMKCWGSHVLAANESIELSLFVAYDLDYNNTKRSDYTNINIELREMLKEIHFISRTSIQTDVRFLMKKGVLTKNESVILFERGYAGKRNAILYTAIKQNMDTLLFLDDDEYPLAVQKENDIESWTGQQVLRTHLKYVDDAYITNGYHCGYISSIPNMAFNDIMTENDFRKFIEAISNDIINWENIKAIMVNGSIKYADADIIASPAVDVALSVGTKFITGSNLCINLRSPNQTKPFYNPPGARGEDTFLSTCIADRKVLRVPCYTFHDGFSLYASMLKGVLPQKLHHVSMNTKKIETRFYNTCVGWVRYKPLLLYITQRNRYTELIEEMRAKLKETLPKLCSYFDDPRYMQLSNELDKYDREVKKHYAAFTLSQSAWSNLMDYTI